MDTNRLGMKPSLRIFAATTLFAAVHSGLASHAAKNAARRLIGTRNRNGLYRAFYIGQSIATFAVLAGYIKRQPGTTLYQVEAPAAFALRAAQLTSLGIATAAAHEVGLARITGWESFRQWRRGDDDVAPEPEAQGPSEEDGELCVQGPFRWSRHPLNFWPLGVLWLNPRMTTNLLAFDVAATLYLLVGSLHEEARLKRVYHQKYLKYQHRDIPFYFPFTTATRPRGRQAKALPVRDPAPAGR